MMRAITTAATKNDQQYVEYIMNCVPHVPAHHHSNHYRDSWVERKGNLPCTCHQYHTSPLPSGQKSTVTMYICNMQYTNLSKVSQIVIYVDPKVCKRLENKADF